MKLLPALVIANSLNWSFGRLNRIERRRPFEAREIQEYQPDVPIEASSSSTTRGHGGDVGILSNEHQDSYVDFYEGSRILQAPPQEDQCPSGYVQCENGYSVVDGEVTSVKCEEACGNEYDPDYAQSGFPFYRSVGGWGGGECCSGEIYVYTSPCQGFTGSVCRDGKSCVGDIACFSANISSVVRSCHGRTSCQAAGARDSNLGKVIDSCQGDFSCTFAAGYKEFSNIPGSIEEIIGSCKGTNACQRAASSGSIKSIIGSCIGESSCESIAQQGSIENIYKSCNGTSACTAAAEGVFNQGANSSSIGGVGILNSCNSDKACYDLAKTNSTDIYNCTGTQVAPFCPNYCPEPRGRFGNITAYNECLDAYCPNPFDNRNCYNCTEGAQQVYPYCPTYRFLAYYDIDNGLDSCCNSDFECEGIKTQDDLPDDCSVSADLPIVATDILSAKLPEDFSPGSNNKKKNKDKKNAPWKKGKGGD